MSIKIFCTKKWFGEHLKSCKICSLINAVLHDLMGSVMLRSLYTTHSSSTHTWSSRTLEQLGQIQEIHNLTRQVDKLRN